MTAQTTAMQRDENTQRLPGEITVTEPILPSRDVAAGQGRVRKILGPRWQPSGLVVWLDADGQEPRNGGRGSYLTAFRLQFLATSLSLADRPYLTWTVRRRTLSSPTVLKPDM